MGNRGAAGDGRQSGFHSEGKVQLLDALPLTPPNAPELRYQVKYDVTALASFFVRSSNGATVESRFDSIAEYRGFVREFDLQPKHAIQPVRYIPGHQFRSSLGKFAVRFGTRDTAPYSVQLDGVPEAVEVIPRIDQFGENLYVVAIRYHGIFAVPALSGLLSPYSGRVRAIADGADMSFLSTIAATAAGVPVTSLESLPKRRLLATAVVEDREEPESFETRMAEFLVANRRSVVALHITGNPMKAPDARLESALVAENAGLNLKSESQLLLLNAQGSTLIAGQSQKSGSAVTRGSAYHNRHARVVDLSEIATAMQHLLLRADARNVLTASSWAGDSRVVERWIRFPENTLNTSVSNQRVWGVVRAAYALSSLLDEYNELDFPASLVGQ